MLVKKMSLRYVLPAVFITMGSVLHAGPAASQADTVDQPLPRIIEVQPKSPDTVEFGEFIEVQVEDLSSFYRNGSFDAASLVLYLNKHRMPNLFAQPGDSGESTILFKLNPDDGNLTEPEREALRQAWRDLLGSPDSVVRLAVDLSYNGRPLSYADTDTSKRQVHFEVYNPWALALGVLLLAIIVAAFIYLARKSDIIRDSGPPSPPPDARRPYSLASTQMAFWTLLVLGAFGFLYLVTTNYQTITEQALILLGIAVATALGAKAIDTTKSNTVNTELDRLLPSQAKGNTELGETRKRIADLDAEMASMIAQSAERNQPLTSEEQKTLDGKKELLRHEKITESEKSAELKRLEQQIDLNSSQLTKPVSENVLRDILTDKDGVTLHRFQIALWTVALGMLFVWEVWEHLAMPAFSTELLALMGISSGTYLGFKWPEKQSD